MFAVAHAARSRTPLPQFMSSPIEAVHAWATAVEEHLNSGTRSRSRSPSSRNEVESTISSRTTSPELAVLYACAEREALYQLSHSVVDVSRTVFRKARIGSDDLLYPPSCSTQLERCSESSHSSSSHDYSMLTRRKSCIGKGNRQVRIQAFPIYPHIVSTSTYKA
jgi:hypothetical protein